MQSAILNLRRLNFPRNYFLPPKPARLLLSLTMRSAILILLVLVSCGRQAKSVPKPDDLIGEEKMIQLLADVHIMEGALLVRSPGVQRQNPMLVRDPSMAKVAPVSIDKNPVPYTDLFQKRGVTRAQFESSLNWYCANPEKLSRIYDDVIAEITKRQAEELRKK
jgi:hypothetical protein